MKTASLGLVVLAVTMGLVGCNESAAPTSQVKRIAVSKLEAAATVAAGAPLDVVLTVEIGGCATFDHISESRSGSQIDLKAWGVVPDSPCATLMNLKLEPHAYRLEPPFPTTFTIVVQPIQFGILLTREVQVQ
jgi:hypothetical protein